MMKSTVRFLAVLFRVITLSVTMTHLFELRVKINLNKNDYQTVQSIYAGWEWLGIFEIGAVLFTFLWTILDQKLKNISLFLLAGSICFSKSLPSFSYLHFQPIKPLQAGQICQTIEKNLEIIGSIRMVIEPFIISWLFLFDWRIIEKKYVK